MTGYDVAGKEGEEKWRQDGTGAPEGQLGKGRGCHAWRGPLTRRESMGMGRDFWGVGGSEGNVPSHSGPGEPAEVLGLNLCPPRPPAATQVLGEG